MGMEVDRMRAPSSELGGSEQRQGAHVPLAIVLLNVLGLALAFVVQVVVITTVGPGRHTDAWIVSAILPNLLLAMLVNSLANVLVPLLSGEGQDSMRTHAWNIFTLVGCAFFVVALLAGVLVRWWIPLLTPGFSTEARQLVTDLTRINLLGLFLTALLVVLTSVYHAKRKFIYVEIVGVLGAIVGLGVIVWWLPRYGIAVAAWAGVARGFLQVVLLLPALGGWSTPSWRNAFMRQAWMRLKPLLLANAYTKAGSLVDGILGSWASPGAFSLFNLAERLYAVPSDVVRKAVAAPVLPSLGEKAKIGDWKGFKTIYRKRVVLLGTVSLLGFLAVLIAGKPILALLIGHGGVTTENIHFLWLLLLAFGGYFVGGMVGQMPALGWYARGNTRVPAVVGSVGFTLGIVLKVVGFLEFGVIGIALGTTVYYVLNACVLHIWLERA